MKRTIGFNQFDGFGSCNLLIFRYISQIFFQNTLNIAAIVRKQRSSFSSSASMNEFVDVAKIPSIRRKNC
jgi:hypothetical protein